MLKSSKSEKNKKRDISDESAPGAHRNKTVKIVDDNLKEGHSASKISYSTDI